MITPISLVCTTCKSNLVISYELIEYMLDFQQEMDKEFDDEIDFLMKGEDYCIDMGYAPFPIAYNEDERMVYVLGWCRTCHSVRISLIGRAPNFKGGGK